MARKKISDIVSSAKNHADTLLKQATAEEEERTREPAKTYKTELAAELSKLASVLRDPKKDPDCVTVGDVKAFLAKIGRAQHA